jgi:molybdopterin-guanine dinucleotide biosynthesis protein A
MKDRITGLVLAGGQGRRMGGIDKGLQELEGRPLAQWVLDRLSPQVGSVLISANRNLDRYAELGCPVLPDTLDGYAGPLAGLQAGLAQAATPLLVTAPCDSPFLPADLVARLHDALVAQQAELAVACAGGRTHRAFCLLRCELLPCLDAFLATGERRVGLWHASLNVTEVDFSDEAAAFSNINTADELERLSK